jgi:hypothetical protein
MKVPGSFAGAPCNLCHHHPMRHFMVHLTAWRFPALAEKSKTATVASGGLLRFGFERLLAKRCTLVRASAR